MDVLEYWLIDKNGNPCQACDTKAWAEAQKLFWQRTRAQGGPYTIRSAPKIERPGPIEHPEKTWSKR